VQALHGLLLNRLDAHRFDLGAAGGFEQRAGVGRIGLVALHVARIYAAGSRRASMPRRASERAQWCAEPHASMMTSPTFRF
jgi:hypothetical protein